MSEKNRPNENKVISLDSYRKKKEFEKEIAGDRAPLYVSHLDGEVKGSPYFKRPSAEDFGDRMQRIKLSLEKINFLMSELRNKKVNESQDTTDADL